MDLSRHWGGIWPSLRGKPSLVMLHRWFPFHMEKTEPYSIAAYIGAIERATRAGKQPVVLDIGANVGAYTLIGAALGARLLAIDMQPTCAALVECHLSLSNLKAEVFNAYASAPGATQVLSVPMEDCVKTASPTAVVGRFPTGVVTKKTLRAATLDASLLRPVPPLHVAQLVKSRLATGEKLAATKIDVEGYEIGVIEALRPAWPLLGDILVEVQPRAWKFANVSMEAGIETFRALVDQSNRRIVSLAHDTQEAGKRRIAKDAVTDPDVCALPRFKGQQAIPSRRRKGLPQGDVLAELDFDGLAAMLRYMMRHPRKSGLFRDFLFTSRQCGG